MAPCPICEAPTNDPRAHGDVLMSAWMDDGGRPGQVVTHTVCALWVMQSWARSLAGNAERVRERRPEDVSRVGTGVSAGAGPHATGGASDGREDGQEDVMASLNKVLLIGNLTRAPEVRYTPGGTTVADLRLAVNHHYTAQGGDKRDEACFLTVVVWGKQAESCGEYLDKGSQVFVEGRLQTRDWNGKDGQQRTVTEIVGERVQFMSRTKSAVPAGPVVDDAPVDDDDDDVPF